MHRHDGPPELTKSNPPRQKLSNQNLAKSGIQHPNQTPRSKPTSPPGLTDRKQPNKARTCHSCPRKESQKVALEGWVSVVVSFEVYIGSGRAGYCQKGRCWRHYMLYFKCYLPHLTTTLRWISRFWPRVCVPIRWWIPRVRRRSKTQKRYGLHLYFAVWPVSVQDYANFTGQRLPEIHCSNRRRRIIHDSFPPISLKKTDWKQS